MHIGAKYCTKHFELFSMFIPGRRTLPLFHMNFTMFLLGVYGLLSSLCMHETTSLISGTILHAKCSQGDCHFDAYWDHCHHNKVCKHCSQTHMSPQPVAIITTNRRRIKEIKIGLERWCKW